METSSAPASHQPRPSIEWKKDLHEGVLHIGHGGKNYKIIPMNISKDQMANLSNEEFHQLAQLFIEIFERKGLVSGVNLKESDLLLSDEGVKSSTQNTTFAHEQGENTVKTWQAVKTLLSPYVLPQHEWRKEKEDFKQQQLSEIEKKLMENDEALLQQKEANGELGKQLETLQNELAQKETENEILQKDLNEATKKLATEKTGNLEKLKEMETDNDELKRLRLEIDQLKEERKKEQELLSKTQKDLQTMSKSVSKFFEEVYNQEKLVEPNSLDATFKEIQDGKLRDGKTIIALQKEIEEQESTIDKLKVDIDYKDDYEKGVIEQEELKKKNEEIQSELQVAKNKAARMQSGFEKSNEENRKVTRENKELRRKLGENNAELEALKNEHQEMTEMRNTLQNLLEEDLHHFKAGFTKELEEKETALQVLEDEKEDLKKKIVNLPKKLHELEKANQNLNQELIKERDLKEYYQEEYEKLREQLRSLKSLKEESAALKNDDVEKITEDINAVLALAHELDNENQLLKEKIKDLTDKLEDYEEKIKDLTAELEEYEEGIEAFTKGQEGTLARMEKVETRLQDEEDSQYKAYLETCDEIKARFTALNKKQELFKDKRIAIPETLKNELAAAFKKFEELKEIFNLYYEERNQNLESSIPIKEIAAKFMQLKNLKIDTLVELEKDFSEITNNNDETKKKDPL